MNNSSENNALVKALKLTNECNWNGTTTHDSLDKCLTGINLYCGTNSGWYTPKSVKVAGLTGYFMINENGNIFPEARVIKKSEKVYLIEYLSNSEYNKMEQNYIKFLNQQQL